MHPNQNLLTDEIVRVLVNQSEGDFLMFISILY